MNQIDLRGYPFFIQLFAKQMAEQIFEAKNHVVAAEDKAESFFQTLLESFENGDISDEQRESAAAFRLDRLLVAALTSYFDKDIFLLDDDKTLQAKLEAENEAREWEAGWNKDEIPF